MIPLSWVGVHPRERGMGEAGSIYLSGNSQAFPEARRSPPTNSYLMESYL